MTKGFRLSSHVNICLKLVGWEPNRDELYLTITSFGRIYPWRGATVSVPVTVTKDRSTTDFTLMMRIFKIN